MGTYNAMKQALSRTAGTALVALGLTLWAPASLATQVIGLDLTGLTHGSDAILVGKVVRSHSRWTSDQRLIVTEVELEVGESLKGAAEERVVILQPGGVVGDIGQQVAGLARFEVGDEVLVFLEKQGRRTFQVTGLAQGKFRVQRSSDQKQTWALPDDVAEAALVDPLTRAPMRSPLRPMPLQDLKARIAELLRAAPPPEQNRP